MSASPARRLGDPHLGLPSAAPKHTLVPAAARAVDTRASASSSDLDATASASAAGPVLSVHQVAIHYGRHQVLAPFSLAVRPGTVYALLGRNGVGKTSLVRCLAGSQRPSSGRVELFGEDVWRHRAKLLTRVGVVPETPDAPPGMTADQLADFCTALYPRSRGAAAAGGGFDRQLFDRHLAQFGVPRKTVFQKLSRGQKTHVQLALAMAPRPALLLLDDPTLGLDAVARRALLDALVVELADHGTTVFLTTHDLDGVERLATHVGILAAQSLPAAEPGVSASAGARLVANEDLDQLRTRVRKLTWPGLTATAAASWLSPAVHERFGLAAANPGPWGLTAVAIRGAGLDDDPGLAGLLAGPTGLLPRVERLDLEAIFTVLTNTPELASGGPGTPPLAAAGPSGSPSTATNSAGRSSQQGASV